MDFKKYNLKKPKPPNNLKPKSKMQFRNIFLLLLTVMLLFAAENALAQKITTNENGEKIILYPDGSWRYFDERLDNPSNKYSSSENSEIGDDSNSVEAGRNQIIKDYRTVLIKAAERAAARERLAERDYEDVQFDRVLVEEELDEALKSTDTKRAEINEIKQRLKEAERREMEEFEKLSSISKAARDAEERTKLSDEEIHDLIFAATNTNSTTDNNNYNTIPSEPASQSKKKAKKVFASYDPDDDVMINPPNKKCNLVFDGVDDFSGKKRKEVAGEILFSYTSDEMRPYFKEKDYIACSAYVSSLTGGYKFLTLEITIASEHAQRDYGIIEKGSVVTIKLMDGGNVKLFNNKTDVGVIDKLENAVTYKAQYIISSGAEKILRKNEIDKIRLIWSSGYEDYEVYNLDFFINQFRCLNSK